MAPPPNPFHFLPGKVEGDRNLRLQRMRERPGCGTTGWGGACGQKKFLREVEKISGCSKKFGGFGKKFLCSGKNCLLGEKNLFGVGKMFLGCRKNFLGFRKNFPGRPKNFWGLWETVCGHWDPLNAVFPWAKSLERTAGRTLVGGFLVSGGPPVAPVGGDPRGGVPCGG